MAGVAAALVALVGGLVASSALYLPAEAAHREAESRARELEIVTNFQNEMLTEIDIPAARTSPLQDIRERTIGSRVCRAELT